jgi:hypothetical protein
LRCLNRRLLWASPPRRWIAQLALAGSALALLLTACGGSNEPADLEDIFGPGVTEPPVLTGNGTAEREVTESGVSGEQTPDASSDGSTGEVHVTRPAPIETDGNLKVGSGGRAVEQLQLALVFLGFDPGPADGAYGPMTKTAVGAYQRATGLKADGIASEATMAAINQEVQVRG